MKTIFRPAFKAILPKPIQIGDEIVLKGKIKNDAKHVSVNFVCKYYDDIAYHFKTNFTSNTVVHNYKEAGRWNSEITDENTWIRGLNDEFILTFHFNTTEIAVHTGDEDRSSQYGFKHQYDMKDIDSVQVWGDVDYISEIIFRYSKVKRDEPFTPAIA